MYKKEKPDSQSVTPRSTSSPWFQASQKERDCLRIHTHKQTHTAYVFRCCQRHSAAHTALVKKQQCISASVRRLRRVSVKMKKDSWHSSFFQHSCIGTVTFPISWWEEKQVAVMGCSQLRHPDSQHSRWCALISRVRESKAVKLSQTNKQSQSSPWVKLRFVLSAPCCFILNAN